MLFCIGGGGFLMLTNLFRLDGSPLTLQSPEEIPAMSPGAIIANVEFRGKSWLAPRQTIKGVTFNNVGMSKTRFFQVTFSDCTFSDCLFIGTQFQEVEFHNCEFANCNFWKAKFEQCYLRPESIRFAKRYRIEAANIGVALYHSLLSNYARERQDAFFMSADIEFRRWKRYQLARDIRKEHTDWWSGQWQRISSAMYEAVAGFGYKPGRFFIVTVTLFFAVSMLNHLAIGDAVLVNGTKPERVTLVDSIFYSFSILTVLGFSSIVPESACAKLLTVFEVLASIGWLSIFTSVLVKRFLR